MNNHEPLVSIIVPVYNVEKYLNRCVDSLVNQTYKNIEILLIDDNSKDSSLRLCEEYEEKDARVKVFHKENEGLGLTRNYGLNRASGEFVMFVDSDDYMVSDAVQVLLSRQMEYGVDVVIGGHYYRDRPQESYLKEKIYDEKEIYDILLVHAMGNSPKKIDALSYTAWGKLYKKSVIVNQRVKFHSEREYIWEDLVFTIDLFPKCKSIYIVNYPIYYYCFNEGSLTHAYKPNKIDKIMFLYRYMRKRIKILNLGNEAIHRLNTNFIGHVRTCIKLEVFYANINGRNVALNNIKNICKNKDVRILIKSYPKEDFSKIQLIYNFFMEHKLIYGVYILTWLQNKKKRIE